MDRKQFMREVYSDYWINARDTKYGFMDYDRHLCDLITDHQPAGGNLLEVAIGTGFPIAGFLAQAGYQVHGIDISPKLIQRCRELNPGITAVVGDAEQLPYPDRSFDGTYCFHSTWYFPDLPRVIAEMIRVTRPGGLVIFDIQNKRNPSIASDFERRTEQVRPGLVPRSRLHARNIAKVLLRRGNPNWHGILYEVPADPAQIRSTLEQLGVKDFTLLGRRESSHDLEKLSPADPLAGYPRLVIKAERP